MEKSTSLTLPFLLQFMMPLSRQDEWFVPEFDEEDEMSQQEQGEESQQEQEGSQAGSGAGPSAGGDAARCVANGASAQTSTISLWASVQLFPFLSYDSCPKPSVSCFFRLASGDGDKADGSNEFEDLSKEVQQ